MIVSLIVICFFTIFCQKSLRIWRLEGVEMKKKRLRRLSVTHNLYLNITAFFIQLFYHFYGWYNIWKEKNTE